MSKSKAKVQKTRSEGDKPLATSKKQKYVGSTTLVDPSTGEAIPMQIVQVEDRDFSFHKVWLKNLIMSIDGISNQRLRLAFWILENLNSENQLVMTQRAIAQKSGMSLNTVIKTMRTLQAGNPAFLQKINSGAYRVNPDVIWKGSHDKRLGVIYDYADTHREAAQDAKGSQDTQIAAQAEPQDPEAEAEADTTNDIPLDDQGNPILIAEAS